MLSRERPSCIVFFAMILVVCLAPSVGAGQRPVKPAAPGTGGDPTWQRMVRLSDGRTLVTDGGLAIDAGIAKPAVLPTQVLGPSSAKILEGYLTAPLKDEFGLGDFRTTATGRTYIAPSGVVLNATYIDYLRRILPTTKLRFRMKGDFEPVVILANGTPIGVLMPVKR